MVLLCLAHHTANRHRQNGNHHHTKRPLKNPQGLNYILVSQTQEKCFIRWTGDTGGILHDTDWNSRIHVEEAQIAKQLQKPNI